MKKTFDIETNLDKDSLAVEISNKWQMWDDARAEWKARYKETLQYLYASDTTQIIGQPSEEWKSTTHIPKLTQIRDLLITYYVESLFSLDNYVEWQASTQDTDTLIKRNLIRDFVKDMLDKGDYKRTTERLIEDYVDSGNAFAMPEFVVDMVPTSAGLKERFRGVKIRRINPMDIVFNPLAIDFKSTPKIIRSVKSLGEIKAAAENNPVMQKAFDRMMKNRKAVCEAYSQGEEIINDSLSIAGFSNITTYMSSDTCEILTFLGDIYDASKDKLHKSARIVVMDRTIVLTEETFEGTEDFNCIFHAGWRNRKDTLWGMSPLENLLGMQYRIDYLENKRADVYDFVSNPVLLALGEVELPEQVMPGTVISGDGTATVRYMHPDVSILQSGTLMADYMALMEEYAGAPREMMGFRTPGEKTAFEYSQMMNAAQRVFQKKIRNYELMTEELINAALHLYLHEAAGQTIELKVWNSEMGVALFKKVNIDDIRGDGQIKAVGSVSYADKAKLAQSIQQLGNNALFMDPTVLANISPAKLGEALVFATGLDSINGLFRKDARLYEMAEQTTLSAQLNQQAQREIARPTLEETLEAEIMMGEENA